MMPDLWAILRNDPQDCFTSESILVRVKFKAAVAVWKMDSTALQVDRAGSGL